MLVSHRSLSAARAARLPIAALSLLIAPLLPAAAAADYYPNLIQDGGFDGSVVRTSDTNAYVYNLGNAWTFSGGGLWADMDPNQLTEVASVYSNATYNGVYYPSYYATGQYTGTGAYGVSPVNDISPVVTASPDGGHFIADDAHYRETISQTVNGLTVGGDYQLSFYQAAAVETTSGVWPSTDSSLPINWQVSFGSTVTYSPVMTLSPQAGDLTWGHTTPVSSVVTNGGWEQVTMNFVATAASETLSFLASGPSSLPPLALLDGVSLVDPPSLSGSSASSADIPEPAELLIFLTGLALMLRRHPRAGSVPVR